MMPKPILTVLAGLALLAGRSAAPETLTLDPGKSQIRFTLGATLHSVHGTLRLERGVLHLDRAAGTATGEVVLDAKSANTANAGRDKDMHEKVLETAKYPRITYTVERLEGKLPESGSAEVKLHGSLDFHGGRHAVTVPAQVTIENGQVTATGKLEIPYVAWGLTDPSKFVLRVDKKVTVDVKVVGRLGA